MSKETEIINNDMVGIKFAKVRPTAIIPTKKDEDAGYDIYACFDKDFMKIPAHETILVPTGIASAFSKEYCFKVEERGSTGSKGIKKSAGIIDSGFRGEWFIAITNANDQDLFIAKNNVVKSLHDAASLLEVDIIVHPYEKAIAQALLTVVPSENIEEITYDELKKIKSIRGEKMLGSSNK